MEDDIHGPVNSETGRVGTTGSDIPGASASRKDHAMCIGAIISGLKELLRTNRVDEAETAGVDILQENAHKRWGNKMYLFSF